MIVNVKLGIFSLLPLIKTITINISLELLCYIIKLVMKIAFSEKAKIYLLQVLAGGH